MNNRIILLAICALVFPLRALCMDVDHMSARDIQERLREYEQTIHGHENNIREGKNAWHSNWDAAALILPSYSFIIPVLAKLWMFKLSHLPRFQNDPVVKYFQNIKWAKYLSVTALTSSIIYGAIRAIQHSSLGKYLSPNYQRMAQAKQALNGQEHIRNRFYQQINERYHNERAIWEADDRGQQLQGAQNQIHHLQEEVRAAQADARTRQNEAAVAQRHQNRLQTIVDQIRRDHPDVIPHQHCAVCDEDRDEMIQLECGHSFCRECLRDGILQNALAANSSETLRCPNPGCLANPRDQRTREFSEQDIRAITQFDANQNETLARYHQIKDNEYLAGLGPDARQCPTPNCNNAWVVEDVAPRPYTCEQCHQTRCANCRVDWNIHQNRTCQAAQVERDRLARMSPQERSALAAEEQFQAYAAANNIIMCVHCQRPIERAAGCDHMVCGRDAHGAGMNGCGYDFCFRCLLPFDAHGVQWYGGGCNGALQRYVAQGNRWALELQRWRNQDPARNRIDGEGNNCGRAHFRDLCQQLGQARAHELFA